MSSSRRGTKRKHTSEDVGDHVQVQEKVSKVADEDEANPPSVSRTGRVRKKSSKILEMEQGLDDLAEVLDGPRSKKKKTETEKPPKVTLLHSEKKGVAKETELMVESKLSQNLPHVDSDNDDKKALKQFLNTSKSPQVAVEGEKVQPKSSSRKSKGKMTEEHLQSPLQSTGVSIKQEDGTSLKFTLHLDQTQSECEMPSVKSPKKLKIKKEKDTSWEPEPDLYSEHHDVCVKEGDSGLKLKLILSPTKEKSVAQSISSLIPQDADTKSNEKKKKKSSKSANGSSGKKSREKRKNKNGGRIEKVKIKDILAAQQQAKQVAQEMQQQTGSSSTVHGGMPLSKSSDQSTLAMHLSLSPTVMAAKQKPSEKQASTLIAMCRGNGRQKKKKSKKKTKEESNRSLLDIPEAAEILAGMSYMGVDPEDSNSGQLEIDWTPRPDAKKPVEAKKGSPKKSIKIKSEPPDEIPTNEPVPQVIDDEKKVYSDTAQMAMKVMTSVEKKAKRKYVCKVRGKRDDQDKPKRRRGPTAYMLWCNTYRNKVIAENPERDFAQISKRLGEIWQGLLEKEKLSWKRKAKKLAAKGSTLISTGKKGDKGTQENSAAVGTSKLTSAGPANGKPGSKSDSEQSQDPLFKIPGTEPIDAAAHLKLLGESLSIIGNRLTEHRGQIAVQGSLSVLLDSMICALAPLTCLTSQLPETDVIPEATLAETLDNIAYIMPGL